jgi:hypothetical protein
MANNNLNQNENILVLVDQQNIVHIDPNTVVSSSGDLQPRFIDHENLVMYVNLEADLVPRSVLYSESQTNTLTSIAEGTFNLLRNQNSANEFENNFDTNWTETFVSNNNVAKSRTTGEGVSYDPSAQTFGIESINITVKGANNIPQVGINFIDVRGKTLFDAPDNSPYKAFFHQPWPIFYLTVKGFYGKAIRYRLQLIDFKSKFNGNTGNFEITTKFTGSSYAFLNDILLQNIINAPFMYMVETPENLKFNEKTGFVEKKVSKSTKGYSILKSVYDEYKAKGYIPENFPVKTLRDLLMTATALDTIIEKELFSQTIEPAVLSDVAQYDKTLDKFEKAIISWGSRYLIKEDMPPDFEVIPFIGSETGVTVNYYRLNKVTNDSTKVTKGPLNFDIITGLTTNNSLASIVKYYNDELEKNLAFGKLPGAKLQNGIETKTIALDSIRNINDFYKISNGQIIVSNEKLINRIKIVQNTFITQRDQVENAVEEKMNQVIQTDSLGFGFKPTIRNVFAVILANADTYIRLMKDVHNKAIQKSDLRKNNIKYSAKGGDDQKEVIYPWPEVKKSGKDDKPTFFYPADPDIVGLTKGNDYNIWPEVEFIETYNSVAVKRVDPGTAKEISPSEILYVFDKNEETKETYNVSSALKTTELTPYINKSISNVLYEIFERANMITSFDTFEYGKGLDEIVKNEFKNISGSTKNDPDIRALLNTKIKTTTDLTKALKDFAEKERFPYFQDQLPTVEYIKSITDSSFKIESYTKTPESNGLKDSEFEKLQSALDSYVIPEYRVKEFPFNSDLYGSYVSRNLALNAFGAGSGIGYRGIFTVNEDQNFISSPINPKAWIKSGFEKNLFTNQIKYDTFTRNLLNTPYFHKQLYDDFLKGGSEGRYVGSAYILLNSLPYKDLHDVVDFDGKKTFMFALLKEVGATHYIPHHLVLKWGAQYHRYKRNLVDNFDIISGATIPISGSTFFDNGKNVLFNLTGNTTPNQTGITNTITGATYNSNLYTGLYPYYHGLYSQIVNGYSFYNPEGFTKTESIGLSSLLLAAISATQYSASVTSGITKFVISKPTNNSGNTFTCLVDNSKFSAKDNRYTLLPSFNANQIDDIVNNFNPLTQDSFRIIYDSNSLKTNPSYSTAYFPNYGEKFENINDEYSLNGNKKRVMDLIAVFGPDILDEFEKMFIEFASLDLDLDTKRETIDYGSFQSLLKEITSISKDGIDFNTEGYESKIKENQTKKLEELTNALLNTRALDKVTIGNPRQIDNYVLFGYVGRTKTYTVNSFNSSQLTTANQKLIELYVGQNITGATYSGISTNLYHHFFQISDIEVTPENIYEHRELARIYAGWVKSQIQDTPGFSPNYTDFKNYLESKLVLPQINRREIYLGNLIRKFTDLKEETNQGKVTIYHGFNETKTTLLDLYQFFKSFNDKWISGNAIGQRSLMDEFLFLDRANRDIGDEAYISLERLISLADEKNIKIDLYSAVSLLIQGTNFDLRPLPAYVNFYGTNSGNKKKILPSKNIAKTLFGTHLDVDYQESSPKIILQYINKTSQYLDMTRVSKEYKFKNDGFDIKNPNGNPLLIEPKIFMEADLSKSNRVVSFEINFGDQAQNIFKNISLDQSTYKNTTESALAQERLARSQGGGGSHSVDIGLFDIYKTASYQCTVTCMGNAMIQPTMYFYLANVPMFMGTYLVFDVSHSIKQGTFETTFTGVRISSSSLPSLESSFMSSYRPLFSRILSAAVKKKQQANQLQTSVKTLTTADNKSFTIDPGAPERGEDLNNIVKKSGFLFTDLIPYNGQQIDGKPEQYIQLITHKNEEWLRTKVCVLGAGKYTPLKDGSPADLSLVSSWKASPNKIIKLSTINELYENYSIRANVTNKNKETIFEYDTVFYSPKNGTEYKLETRVDPNAGLFEGPIHNGPSISDATYGKFGAALSPTLMRKLKLVEGDVVYIKYIKI